MYIHVYYCNNKTHDNFCSQSLSYSKGEDTVLTVLHITSSNLLEKLWKLKDYLPSSLYSVVVFGFFLYSTHSLQHYVKKKSDSMTLSQQESCTSASVWIFCSHLVRLILKILLKCNLAGPVKVHNKLHLIKTADNQNQVKFDVSVKYNC